MFTSIDKYNLHIIIIMIFFTLTEATKVNDHWKICFQSYNLEIDEIEVFVDQKGKWPDKIITNQISKIFMKIPGRSANGWWTVYDTSYNLSL